MKHTIRTVAVAGLVVLAGAACTPQQRAFVADAVEDHSSPPADGVPLHPASSRLPAARYPFAGQPGLCQTPAGTIAIPCGDVINFGSPDGTVFIEPATLTAGPETPMWDEFCALVPPDQWAAYGKTC